MIKKLPRFAVEHPMVMIPVFLAIIGAGIYAYFHLPIELQPYLESPVVGIVITYPGVSAEEMETYFSRPIEQKMSVLDGVLWIRSHSQEGRAEIAVGFDYGTDMNKNKVSTQTLLSNMLNELPLDKDNTTNPWVVHIDAQNVPVLDLNWSREGWDEVRFREFVENKMRDEFEKLPGVQSAIPYGGKRRLALIEVDRDRLNAFHLGLMDIKMAVERQSLSRSGGKLVGKENEFLVRVDERYRNPAEMNAMPIGNFKDRIVYLRDVATVKDTYAEVRSAYHSNARRGLLLTIVKEPHESDVTVINAALKLADQFVSEYPGLNYEVAYNRKDFLDRIIANAWKEMFLAFAITSVVVLAFLNQITPTLIVMVTLPAAAAAGFVWWRPFGFTVNTPTLMALTFVIGRLVDDSVVMMDVINRHLRMGKPPKQAAIEGAQEISGAVVAVGMSSWIAMGPALFLGGSMGTGFRGMTAPMIFANAFSTFFTLTLDPMLRAYLLKSASDVGKSRIDRFLRWVFTPWTWLLDRLEHLYREALHWGLDHRMVVVAVGVATVYIGLQLYPYLGFEGMPLQDTGQAVGEVEAWPGTSFAETEKIVSRVEGLLLRQPEIVSVSTQIGQEPAFGTFFSGYGVRTVNKAFFKLTMTPTDERTAQFYHRWLDPITGAVRRRSDRDIWQINDSVQQEAMATIPGIRSVWLMEMGATPVNTARAPVEAVVKGDDLETLWRLGQEGKRVAERTPGVVQPFTSWSMTQPQYRIRIDRARAQELGLAVPQVAMQAFYATQGGMTAEFFKPEEGVRHSRYVIRYRPDQRLTPEDLEQVSITAPTGQHVPLKEVATVEKGMGTDTIYKEDLQYAISILGQYRNVGLKAATAGLIMGAKTSLNLPKGYTVGPKGLMIEMMDNIDRLNKGLAVALGILFILLLLQTQSIPATLAILMDAPLEMMGALFFLYIRGMNWSPPVLWGIMLATVMVMATGIFLIDKTEQLIKEEKMDRRKAITTAGPIRLRPVLMTTLTTASAFIPPMFAPPTGMDRFRPIATAIIGALVSSTLLSLVAVPVFYSIFDDFAKFLRRLFAGEAEAEAREEPVPRREAAALAGGDGSGGSGEA